MFYTFKLLPQLKIGRSQPAEGDFHPNRPLGWALLLVHCRTLIREINRHDDHGVYHLCD